MKGAIIGDIVGSKYEFDRGGLTKVFELFDRACCSYTDDTVMTVAVGKALMTAGSEATPEMIHEAVTRCMRELAIIFPDAGYGGRFYHWLFFTKYPKPYGSWGNGSAMRVSAAGLLYDTMERTREVARATAEVTHNHPEGIKGAECTAAVMFLARQGASKEEIKEYVVKEFGYNVSESLEQLRRRHRHDESCMDSLPKALVSFFEGKDFEDVIRNAVSLGGDTDTLAAIAGAMAEAYYGVPDDIWQRAKIYIPGDLWDVVCRFEEMTGEAS